MSIIGPRGWSPSTIEKRFVSNRPSSYNPDKHTVDAVISVGAAVPRFYGTEILRITPDAVDLSRLYGAGIPILDSHQQVGISNSIGRLAAAWFEPGQLLGKISFNDTDEGRKAEGMTARSEIKGISGGYRVSEWEVKDSDGNIVDTEKDRIRWDDRKIVMNEKTSRGTIPSVELVTAGINPLPVSDAVGILDGGLDRVTLDQLQRVATHEAGHVVAGRASRLPVDGVTIDPAIAGPGLAGRAWGPNSRDCKLLGRNVGCSVV